MLQTLVNREPWHRKWSQQRIAFKSNLKRSPFLFLEELFYNNRFENKCNLVVGDVVLINVNTCYEEKD